MQINRVHFNNNNGYLPSSYLSTSGLPASIDSNNPNSINDHDIPSSIHSKQQLVELLTTVISGATVQHAVSNYSQFSTYAFVPNQPASLMLEPPSEKGNTDLKRIMKTLPDKAFSSRQIAIGYVLSSYNENDTFLGDYKELLFYEKKARDVVSQFQKELKEAGEIIKERNTQREVPYDLLLPEKIPNSITI